MRNDSREYLIQIDNHLNRYWRICRDLFARKEYALSAFLAITLIEEVGKLIILGNKEILDGKELDQRGLYDHRRKYLYAVGTTLIVNSRMTRTYGKDELRFASWFSEGKLFEIRNSSLYLDVNEGSVRTPEEAISKYDAFLLICIAGEVYAEIQGQYTGTGPDAWKRVLKEVDEFRLENANGGTRP
jgi:AbiV family abortive infection protein